METLPFLMHSKNQCCQNGSKALYEFSMMPLRLPTVFFKKVDETFVKIIWYNKSPGIAKAILGGGGDGRHYPLKFQTALQSGRIKTV